MVVDGREADVALSFRAVANPEFPRAGRRYGAFVGSRGSSRLDKVALGLKHPLTAVEMLAYKYGVQLPFDPILIHATIASHGKVGTIGAAGLAFEPDRACAADMALSALDAFVADCDIDRGAYRVFDANEIRSSLISGAQFCCGGPLPDAVDAFLQAHRETLHVADTGGLRFTSIYNQGLLTMARGYGLGADLARST